jgi:hypothetical protein
VRATEALNSWTNALKLAADEFEREGVYIHLARFKYTSGRTAEARQLLDAVTNSHYGELKTRLLRNIKEMETSGKTNASTAGPAEPPTNAPVSPPPAGLNLHPEAPGQKHSH